MGKVLSSRALEDNMLKTLDIDIEIPEKQEWFAQLSKSAWGIHNRTREFVTELNHKYRNDMHVIELLRRICLEDFWFYNSLDDSDEALTVLLDIFESLFDSVAEESARETLIMTLFQFMDRLSTQSVFPKKIIFRCFFILEEDIHNNELLYIRLSRYFKTFLLNRIGQDDEFMPIVLRLTSFVLDRCIDYWEKTSDAEAWFQSKRHYFNVMDTDLINKIGSPFFEGLRAKLKQSSTWKDFDQLIFYNDISHHFRNLCKQFDSSLETIYYLYYLLHLPGMATLYDHLLYDINRSLRSVFKELEPEDIPDFLDVIISELNDFKTNHGRTVLDCIATLGKEVIETEDKNATSYFIRSLVKFGFIHPGHPYINGDWQVHSNKNHVKNIRVYLDLIGKCPSAMSELLNALIVELKIGGIYISDTDLFQRDVTKLLNSDIGPVYREIKQLARIFPVFFRDIGAEGALRTVTTEMDALSMRQDQLIHFLRVQIHVESNNTNIELTRKIMEYWYDGNTGPLREILPEELYRWLDGESEWYPKAHEALCDFCQKLSMSLSDLLKLNFHYFENCFKDFHPSPDIHQKKILDLFQIHALLLEKYSFETENVISLLRNIGPFAENDLEQLKDALANNHCEQAIGFLYKMMNHLKSVILNPEKTEAFENIQYKRHIAAGIPSTYGWYIEPKFESLGLMYRLERVVSQLMAQVLRSFSHEYITAKTLRQIFDVLLLFKEGLALDGIYDQSFNSHLDMFKYSLTSPSFSLNQYINIFQFISKDISQIIQGYFLNVYERPLAVIIPQILSAQDVPEREHTKEKVQMEMEKFFRDILSSAFLVQELDSFIANTIGTLRSMIDNYSDTFIENMLTYDPDLTFSLLSQKTMNVDNPVFLGAKAFFLKKLSHHGFPIPPGFVITTEVFRHIDTIFNHPFMQRDFEKSIEQSIAAIEYSTGQKFSDTQNPLLFSVRSGSFISFPGAMKTFLNVGLNDEIAEALSLRKGFGWDSWDCYRRFLQSWGMAFGIERDIFDKVMLEHKERRGVELKIQFTKEQMLQIALDYKKILLDHPVYFEHDPFKQLKIAIRCVLDSWSSQSAMTFQDYMQIANEWGTAVLVQKMILGNLSGNSGTGVVFTSSPYKDYSSINLYGDFAICSQGEDVVSGLVNTLPISEAQRKNQFKEPLSLESAFPQIYMALHQYAKCLIEQHGFVHQEIEFTFEDNQPESLYILQTRNQKITKRKKYEAFSLSPNEMKRVGHGIGVGNGVLSGFAAFDMEDMERIKEESPGAKTILVRPDTVPDDIPMLFVCDGIITAKGGVTSHAAVTAVGLGKVCIVKCRGLKVNESEKKCVINGHCFSSGDPISIDGSHGNIYEGNYEYLKD